MRVLIIDNYDSFVHNIIQAVEKTGVRVDMVENNRIAEVRNFNDYAAAIISPGPGNPMDQADRGDLLKFIEDFGDRKIMGICFGHQVLAYHLGSRIVRSAHVMHGEVDTVRHNGAPLYRGVPREFQSARYHSLEIIPSDDVEVDSRAQSDNAVMGFHSHDGRKVGIQFHPESYYSQYGEKLLNNFLVM